MNSDTSGLGPQMLPQAMQIGGLRSHNEALNFYHCSVQLACFFSFQNLAASCCCLPVQSAQQLHDAKKHTMAQKDSSGSTHSVEEVAGEQHREDGDQQQAPVQGSSVQLHWQHGIIGAGLRQCLQHHW